MAQLQVLRHEKREPPCGSSVRIPRVENDMLETTILTSTNTTGTLTRDDLDQPGTTYSTYPVRNYNRQRKEGPRKISDNKRTLRTTSLRNPQQNNNALHHLHDFRLHRRQVHDHYRIALWLLHQPDDNIHHYQQPWTKGLLHRQHDRGVWNEQLQLSEHSRNCPLQTNNRR